MLTAFDNTTRTNADAAVRSQDYLCPSCSAIVRVRHRKGWVPHFYHLVGGLCAYEGEGHRHRLAKWLIGEEYRRRGCEVAYEWSAADERARRFANAAVDRVPERRTDVMLWRDGKSYAVELQDSRIKADVFKQRTRDWEGLGTVVLWLCLPSADLSEALSSHQKAAKEFIVQRHAIRPHEQLIFKRCGHVWYFEPRLALAFRAEIMPHLIEVPSFGRYVPKRGDFIYSDGYQRKSVRYVDLCVQPPVKLGDLRIDASQEAATWR